jgi:hypothetical protein
LKKIFIFLFLIGFCKVHALYQENPASCEFPQLGLFIPEERALGFKMGYQTEYVFNRKMRINRKESSFLEGKKNRLALMFNQVELTLNCVDRVEAFMTLGAMSFSLKGRGAEELKSHPGLTWSIGGRAVLLFWDKLSFGAAASYLSSYPKWEQPLINKKNFKKQYQEWQIELTLSQRLDPASFYIGGAYAYAELGRIPKHPVLYQNRHALSLVLGLSLFGKRGWMINVESKSFGETSLAGSFTLRF